MDKLEKFKYYLDGYTWKTEIKYVVNNNKYVIIQNI